jgi:hypothetical protein
MGRIVKYIPGEVIGLYVTLSGILEGSVQAGGGLGGGLATWYWIGFAVFLALSPLWMWLSTARAGKPTQWYQVVVTPLAFSAWAFALGGPFRATFQYNPAVGSVVLLLVTAAIGLFDEVWSIRAKEAAKAKPAVAATKPS